MEISYTLKNWVFKRKEMLAQCNILLMVFIFIGIGLCFPTLIDMDSGWNRVFRVVTLSLWSTAVPNIVVGSILIRKMKFPMVPTKKGEQSDIVPLVMLYMLIFWMFQVLSHLYMIQDAFR